MYTGADWRTRQELGEQVRDGYYRIVTSEDSVL